MRSSFFILICAASFFFIACGGKNSSAPVENDTAQASQPDSAAVAKNEAKAALASAQPFLEKELSSWAKSFKGFHIGSFKYLQTSTFGTEEYEMTDLKDFYSLYSPSLSYSPDSSHFIDLYSYGLTLERKGKKIIAIGDVDNGVTLCNLKTKEWKRILFFGPSAGIEESVWISPSKFLLAGFSFNDEGKSMPLLLIGDTNNKSLRWFEAGTTRPEGTNYTAESMKKLKIDEWE